MARKRKAEALPKIRLLFFRDIFGKYVACASHWMGEVIREVRWMRQHNDEWWTIPEPDPLEIGCTIGRAEVKQLTPFV